MYPSTTNFYPSNNIFSQLTISSSAFKHTLISLILFDDTIWWIIKDGFFYCTITPMLGIRSFKMEQKPFMFLRDVLVA
jgi:hypothetical protein